MLVVGVGVMLVVVVGMEEEMEERMVVEMVVEKVEKVAGQGGTMTAFLGCCWLAVFQFLKEEEGNK